MITKQRIYEELKHQIELVILDIEQMLESIRKAKDLDEEDTRDIDDLARQDEDSNLHNSIELQLQKVLIKQNTLQSLDLTEKEAIFSGSVVITDQNNFFISVPNPEFDIDNTSFIGIGTDAPIYLFMKGKKKGDAFKYGKKIYTIKEVY